MKIGYYVEIENNKIVINNKINEKLNLNDNIQELQFLVDLYENKNIKIGNSEYMDLNFNASDEQLVRRIKVAKDNLIYLKKAKDILLSLNLPINSIKLEDVLKYENDACKLYKIINDGLLISLPNIKDDKLIDEVDIMGNRILVYFIKQENGLYRGYDFLNDNIVLENLVVYDGEKVQLSRYFNLSYSILTKINLNEDMMINELKKTTKNEVTISYINYLMLEFIKSYDFTKNVRYLNIAMRINKLLRKQRFYYPENLYKINKFQILKRLNKLTEENKNSIIRMKINTDDISIKCSCCLLMEDYNEFLMQIKSFDEETRKLYKTWAIYNLLPQKYRKDN